MAVFGVVMVYPPVAAVVRDVYQRDAGPDAIDAGQRAGGGVSTTGDGASSSPELSPLSLKLLAYSCGLAAGGAVLSLILALPGAYVVGRAIQIRKIICRLVVAVTVLPLLFAPMVYGFGWDRVVGGRPGNLACIWVWASWAWPIGALFLGGVWARSGQDVYREALTVTGWLSATVRVVLPTLRLPMAICGLVLFAFFLGDYTVPHACGLMVSATDLLAIAESGASVGRLLTASSGVCMAILIALGVVGVLHRKTAPIVQDTSEPGRRIGLGHLMIPLGLSVLTMGPPLWRLTAKVDVVGAVGRAIEIYGAELAVVLAITMLGGLVSVGLGMGVMTLRRGRSVLLMWSILLAAVPGALLGQMIVIAFLPYEWLYNHWLLMVIAYVARFGWIGLVAAWLARAAADRDQIDAARSDGADEAGAFWHVAYRSHWPILGAAVFVVASLSLAEVATTSLVRVPGVTPVSLLLVEKFHRFEDDMLVALSLLPMMAVLPAAVMGVFLIGGGWRSSKHQR